MTPTASTTTPPGIGCSVTTMPTLQSMCRSRPEETTMNVTYAVQTIDLSRGETDWTTTPPIRQWETDAGPDEAAEEIATRRSLGFLASVRGRVAVWLDPDGVTFGTGIRTPDGAFEVTR